MSTATSTASASSSSGGHLFPNKCARLLENFQKFINYLQKVNSIAEKFWTSSNNSRSEIRAYLEFQRSNRGMAYTVGTLKKSSTTFI
jgi:hypothetical protein